MKSLFASALLVFVIPAAASNIEIKDDYGRRLVLPEPAKRIVSLAPHLTELVFSAGAGDKLAGVSRHCDYPAQVENLPKVSDYQTINYEQITALKADLALVWNAGLKASQLAKLNKIVPWTYIVEPRSFDDIARHLKDIGTLAGTLDTAAPKADTFIQQIQALRRKHARHQPVTVTYLVWLNPPMTVNGQHWISRVIELCGGKNAYAQAAGEISRLNRESLVLKKSDLILHSIANTPTHPPYADMVFVESDLVQRPSLRILNGAERICAIIASTP